MKKVTAKAKEKKTTSAQVVIQSKMNYNPKVSIIVPVYNVEQYLPQCLDSILNQKLHELEIVCVDDGSTDNSLEILKEYAKKDNRITVVSRENKGAGYSRNQAIQVAKGEFVAFMDPDDWYPSEEVLSRLYASAQKHKVKICGGTSLIVYDESKQEETKKEDFFNRFPKEQLCNYSDFQYDYGYTLFVYNRNMIVKNKVFFPDYKRFQDPPFMVKAFSCAKQFYITKDCVYAYRRSHKEINWTEEKVYGLISGLRDNLVVATHNDLDRLYNVTLNRINKDYKSIILSQSSDRINKIKQEIMSTCLKHAHDRYKKDLTKYKVSVVLPIYNAGLYLRECLNSVVNQTLKNIEIICVNDGSTDNSLDIIKEYANKDKRIKYIDKPNAGYGQTMNCGIDLARGEYIGIVEPDDFVKPDMYETLYNKAKELDLDVIKADYCEFLGENKHYKYTNKKVFNAPDSFYNRVLNPEKDEKILYVFAINPAGIFKHSFLNKYQIRHNETPGAAYQDNGFWAQTTYLADRLYFMNRIFYCYRQDNPNQSMKKKNNVWTIPTEYHFIDNVFAKHKKLNKLRSIYVFRKFVVYIYHMTLRLDIDYWLEYLTAIGQEFKQHEKNGDIDRKYFNDNQWNDLQMIMNNPQDYIKKHKTGPDIIISLTSYPARIGTVNQTIETLLNQTKKADKVILWLAPEQFPNREGDLPQQLLDLCNKGLTIDWYHDIKSYKKLIPALQKYPDAIIVTTDDDALYDKDMLKNLYESYLNEPNIIHCHRAHKVTTTGKKINKYKDFIWCGKLMIKEHASFNIFFTGVGGVLYPPHCLDKNVLNEDEFMSLCPHGDDIWFWGHALLHGTKTKIIEKRFSPETIDGTQETALYFQNVDGGENDRQISNLVRKYPQILKKLSRTDKPKTKSYLLFPYYLLANMWMKVVSIPLAKFKKHTKQVWYSHSARGRMDKILQHIESVKKDLYNQVRQTQNQINTINSRFDNITRKYDDNYNKIQQMLINRFDSVNTQFGDINSRFDGINAQFNDVNSRFDSVNTQFGDINSRFDNTMRKYDDNYNKIQQMLVNLYTLKNNEQANKLEFRTFGALAHCIRQNLYKIPNNIDLVVGVPRSGMIPAYIIALFMNKKCCSLDEFIAGINSSNGFRGMVDKPIRNVLIVDDSIYSGSEMTRVRKKLTEFKNYNFKFMAVYARTQSVNLVDVYFEKVDRPRVWQWNYLNHNFASRACFDMDGVLCVDPTEEQNDDGEKYEYFIQTAKPLYIPNYKIRAIVTARLEKYRKLTEKWLADNGVQYQELIMLDLPNKEERLKLKCHSQFKADVYKKMRDTVIFIESNPQQAKEIAIKSGKQVLCVENDELY